MTENEMTLDQLESLFKAIIFEETYGSNAEAEKLWMRVPAYKNFLALKKAYKELKKDFNPKAPEFSEIETFDYKTYKVGDYYELYDPTTQSGKFYNSKITDIVKIDQYCYKVFTEKGGTFRVKGVMKEVPLGSKKPVFVKNNNNES